MKKIIGIAVALLIFAAFGYAQTAGGGNPAVYIVGRDGSSTGCIPVYWKNGVRFALTRSPGRVSAAAAIAVVGSDVYIAGNDNDVPCYWKNSEQRILPKMPNSVAAYSEGIAVVNNDVYAAGTEVLVDSNGYNYSIAVYWKNGVRYELPRSDRARSTEVAGIAVAGNDVYIIGKEDYYDGKKFSYIPIYWKNGVRHELPSNNVPMFPVGNIYIDGRDVYISGDSGMGAGYWKNDQWITLQPDGRAYEITIAGKSVYVVGFRGKDIGSGYWKDGVWNRVLETPSKIAVNGNVVYMTGRNSNGRIWWEKDGVRQFLPEIGTQYGYSTINAIALVWE